MDPGLWLDVAQSVAMVMLWLRQPGEAATTRVIKVEADINVLRETIRHLPPMTRLTDLERTVHGISAKLDSLDDGVKVTRAGVQQIKDFLLEHR